MPKRGAQGAGTIRKKSVIRNGKEYTYWEARITTGRDPGTGKQIQRSFSGKTQKEVREKLQAVAVEVNTGTYIAPVRLTVAQWLDIWVSEYTGNLKPMTVTTYKGAVNNHIKPSIGAVRLTALTPHAVQTFVNGLHDFSPSTVVLIYKVLHMALRKAVRLGYIPKAPTNDCVLPKAKQPEIKPLEDAQTVELLDAAKNTEVERIIHIALFTGMRESEILGLTWDAINLKNNTITISKQLALASNRNGGVFASPKNGKTRIITAAPSVMAAIKSQKAKQAAMQMQAGKLWSNEYNLVFTRAHGQPIAQNTVRNHFNAVAKNAGLSGVRFHDLRHTYAVNALRAGDDIKTVQGNLGHSSAAFTLERYGHFTEQMQLDSAARMERFMSNILAL